MVKTAPKRETIAIGFDFDETLAADSARNFLESIGVSLDEFWERVHRRVDDGWQPIPAQLYELVAYSRAHRENRITRQAMADFARNMTLYDGVEEMFDRVVTHAKRFVQEVDVEFYIISCGIAEIVRNTRIAERFRNIWANEFHFDDSGEIAFPRLLVSHTEKIGYLYQIAAGIESQHEVGNPFAVNQRIPDYEMRVPLDQMIYVGDGLTDITTTGSTTPGTPTFGWNAATFEERPWSEPDDFGFEDSEAPLPNAGVLRSALQSAAVRVWPVRSGLANGAAVLAAAAARARSVRPPLRLREER